MFIRLAIALSLVRWRIGWRRKGRRGKVRRSALSERRTNISCKLQKQGKESKDSSYTYLSSSAFALCQLEATVRGRRRGRQEERERKKSSSHTNRIHITSGRNKRFLMLTGKEKDLVNRQTLRTSPREEGRSLPTFSWRPFWSCMDVCKKWRIYICLYEFRSVCMGSWSFPRCVLELSTSLIDCLSFPFLTATSTQGREDIKSPNAVCTRESNQRIRSNSRWQEMPDGSFFLFRHLRGSRRIKVQGNII